MQGTSEMGGFLFYLYTMNPRLENIINEFSRQKYSNDVLGGIAYAVKLETVLMRILSFRYLDYNSMAELESLDIPVTKYIGEFKNITEDEARSLIDYKYVTSDVVLDVLEFVLSR